MKLDETEYQRHADSKIRSATRKGGEILRVDMNTIMLLVIAIELGMIYLKMERKK